MQARCSARPLRAAAAPRRPAPFHPHAVSGGLSAAPHRTSHPRGRRGALLVRNMFTGIVQGTAEVVSVETLPGLSQIQVKLPPGKAQNIQIGASVSINGTCLTVTHIAPTDTLQFDIMSETLRATNLGGLSTGSTVNFERSARVGDEIGGHNVSGHVHTTAKIVAVEDTPNNRRVSFQLSDPKWVKYVLPKGYIAVDGCSLTVGEVWDGDKFSVYLIPETIRVTVFGVKGPGDSVNVEIEAQTQAIVDTVERVVAQYMAKGPAAAAVAAAQ